MAEKSIDPTHPNFDAGLATNYHALRDRYPGIQLEPQDSAEDDTDDDDDALEHYIPDDIQNDPRPREDRD